MSDDPGLTPRLRRRIAVDFGPSADSVIEALEAHQPPLSDKQDRERLLAAVVLLARGDRDAFDEAVALSSRDWRDALVASGLANGDWPDRLREELGD